MSQNPLKIGIVFDQEHEYAHIPKHSSDQYAEFEPESTIEAMEKAIQFLGHQAVRIGGPLQLLNQKPTVDVIWNIGEGFGTRNREAWAPILCELYGIPCLGSDAYSLSLSLDKSLSKEFAKKCGIPTAEWQIASFQTKEIPSISQFPVFLKPRYEGTAKGISANSLVYSLIELKTELERLWNTYQQDIMLEKWLPGAEFTIAIAGNPLGVLDSLERGIDPKTKIGIHALENKGETVHEYELSNTLTKQTEQQLAEWSLKLAKEMEILDFARLDFKCDEHGIPHFLEINPLPTFATDNTFAILAEIQQKSYTEFLAEILDQCLKRVLKSAQ